MRGRRQRWIAPLPPHPAAATFFPLGEKAKQALARAGVADQRYAYVPQKVLNTRSWLIGGCI